MKEISGNNGEMGFNEDLMHIGTVVVSLYVPGHVHKISGFG